MHVPIERIIAGNTGSDFNLGLRRRTDLSGAAFGRVRLFAEIHLASRVAWFVARAAQEGRADDRSSGAPSGELSLPAEQATRLEIEFMGAEGGSARTVVQGSGQQGNCEPGGLELAHCQHLSEAF